MDNLYIIMTSVRRSVSKQKHSNNSISDIFLITNVQKVMIEVNYF